MNYSNYTDYPWLLAWYTHVLTFGLGLLIGAVVL